MDAVRFPRKIGTGCSVLVLLMVLCLRTASAQAAADYVEGEVIVTFKSSQSESATAQLLQNHSLSWARHYQWLSKHTGKQLGLLRDKTRTTAQLIRELSREPGVETVEPNYIRHIVAFAPNDPYYPQLWAMQNTGQAVNGAAGTPGADIKFPEAWSLARPTTDEVVVAVIDTGVDLHHPDIISNLWVNPGVAGDTNSGDVNGYDFADNTPAPQDSGYHGTHVSGTIAAVGNNQSGVIGVDFQAKIMALKVSSDGETINSDAEIAALDYAAMMKGLGVNIVAANASYGGPSSNNLEMTAISAFEYAGIVFCAAAGNNGSDNDTTHAYPASYRLPNMIVVAATDQNDALAGFSDYGPNTVDIGAPGVNILSLAPTNYSNPTPPTLCYAQCGTSNYAGAPMTYAGTTPGISGTMYYCGLGNPGNFPAAVSNNLALIQRGTLTFAAKVQNAMNAGAKAAVIFNNVSGNFNGTLQNPGNWIPAFSLSQSDGLNLEARLPANCTVVNALLAGPYQFLDGTSMATPHVAAAVAFAAMNFPFENVTQRIARVLSNADVVPGLQGRVHNGARLNLQRIVDTDGNGLPDWWELQYFGHLTGTDPNADPDHDEMSDLAEFLAGTNPTNPASSLHLVVPNILQTNGFHLQWASVAGRSYRILRTTNLSAGFTFPVATNLAATPPTNTFVDSAPRPVAQALYRLQLEQ